jgi:hypothetical protein
MVDTEDYAILVGADGKQYKARKIGLAFVQSFYAWLRQRQLQTFLDVVVKSRTPAEIECPHCRARFTPPRIGISPQEVAVVASEIVSRPMPDDEWVKERCGPLGRLWMLVESVKAANKGMTDEQVLAAFGNAIELAGLELLRQSYPPLEEVGDGGAENPTSTLSQAGSAPAS